jgi:hypothetical protein
MSSGHYCDKCHQNQYNCQCTNDTIELKYDHLSPNQKVFDFSVATPNAETINAIRAATALIRKRIEEQPQRFTDITRGNIEHLGPDLSGMVDKYPQPLKYGWNDVNKFKPPSGKLQFYTIGGTCIYGDYVSMAPGFVTDWSYLLPSPSKQRGAIK